MTEDPSLAQLEEPFVKAISETFEKMLGAGVYARPGSTAPARDLTAVIGFTGGKKGAIALSFQEDVACRIVSRFAGETLDRLGAVVADGAGELLNIIAGRAKTILAREAGPISMSLPTVVIGPEHEIHGSRTPPLQIVFESELGSFELLVLVERPPAAQVGRVLIADDSRVMRKLLRSALKEVYRDVEIVEAENGAIARTAIERAGDAIDLVVLDIHMPEVSGIAVLEEMRRRPNGAKVPVLIATSDPDAERLVAEAEQRAGVAGPTRVLKKPFTQVELLAAARAVAPAGVGA